jgi:hypothetical protein
LLFGGKVGVKRFNAVESGGPEFGEQGFETDRVRFE